MPHVLIVDGDAKARSALLELVGREGYTSSAVADLGQARLQAMRQQPDAVLIDLALPEGAGGGPSTRAVLIGGYASIGSAVAALRAGAAGAALLGADLLPAYRATGSSVEIPVGMSLAEADKRLILATLERCGGVKKHAAALLGISLKTLYNRLDEYGLQAQQQGLAAGG